MGSKGRRNVKQVICGIGGVVVVCAITISALPTSAADRKPNILIIWGEKRVLQRPY